MDELRIQIWDLLYHAQVPQTIGEIAESTDQDVETICAAVEHEWFTVDGDPVTISTGTGST